jgi:hypothetical protein
MKIIMTALKGIKLLLHPEEKELKHRINYKKLIKSLVYKLNDSKELVRNEVEHTILEF